MADTFTPSLRLELQAIGGNANIWGNIANTQYQLLEAAITGDNGFAGGAGGINIAGLTSYTVSVAQGTADQARQYLLPFVGALTADCTVTIPAVVRFGLVLNATTGGFNVILRCGGGGYLMVPAGAGHVQYYCDGINVYLVGGTRIRLGANLNMYVAPGGSDSAGGLSSATAFATPWGAWNALMARYDVNGFNVTINIANGTYNGNLVASGNPVGCIPGPSSVFLNGNSASPTSVTITATNTNVITAVNGAVIGVSGMSLNVTGATSNVPAGIFVGNAGYGNIAGAMTFSNIPGSCLSAYYGGVISCANPTLTAYGSGGNCFASSIGAGSNVVFSTTTIATPNAPTYAAGFFNVQNLGGIFGGGLVFPNFSLVHGPKYSISGGGSINTFSGNQNYLPGDVAGINTGGFYQ